MLGVDNHMGLEHALIVTQDLLKIGSCCDFFFRSLILVHQDDIDTVEDIRMVHANLKIHCTTSLFVDYQLDCILRNARGLSFGRRPPEISNHFEVFACVRAEVALCEHDICVSVLSQRSDALLNAAFGIVLGVGDSDLHLSFGALTRTETFIVLIVIEDQLDHVVSGRAKIFSYNLVDVFA